MSVLPLWHSFLTPASPHPPQHHLRPPYLPLLLLLLLLSPTHNSMTPSLRLPPSPLNPYPFLTSQHRRNLRSLLPHLSHHLPSPPLTPLQTFPHSSPPLTLHPFLVQSRLPPGQSRLSPFPLSLPRSPPLLPSPLHALPTLYPIPGVGLQRWR